MEKHKILIQGNNGVPGQLTDECINFIKSKGGKYPDILGERHNPILIEMFNKFSVPVRKDSNIRVLYTKPIKGCGDYRGYYQLKEIEGDTYYIDDYDGEEFVVVPEQFKWIKINNKKDNG